MLHVHTYNTKKGASVIFSKRKPVVGIIIEEQQLHCMIFDLSHTEFCAQETAIIPLTNQEVIGSFIFNPTLITNYIRSFINTAKNKPAYVMFACTQPLIQETLSMHLDQTAFDNPETRWIHRPLANQKIYSFGMQRMQLLQFQLICSLLRLHCLVIAPGNQCILEVLSKRNKIIDPPLESIKHLEEILDIELFEHGMVSTQKHDAIVEQKKNYQMFGLYLLGRKFYERNKQPYSNNQPGSL